MSQPSILVAIADDPTRTFIADNLTADGYEIHVASYEAQAAARAATHSPALLLLGALETHGRDTSLLKLIRSGQTSDGRLDPRLPVVAVVPRGELTVMRAFDAGADDVLTIPFSYIELRARIAAVLRRTASPVGPRVRRVGDLVLDPISRTVTVAGRPVPLAAKEFTLLQVLANEPTRVFTKPELLSEIWGYPSGSSRSLDSHAYRLRTKLCPTRRFVVSVWGVGYRLVDHIERPPAVAGTDTTTLQPHVG